MRLPRAQTHHVIVERDLRVPMDDGVVLLTDRWVAASGATGPQPTVLMRTPYGRIGTHARLLAERGLQVVVQSVRGTFGSGGDFNAFDERADGLATLRWIAEQPWHRGQIGMTGGSYLGLVQWALAPDAGPILGAMATSVSASQFYGQAHAGGSFSLQSMASWLVLVAEQERRFAAVRVLRDLHRLPALLDQVPIGDLDVRASGSKLAWYRDGLEHRARDDAYWMARDFSASVASVEAPVQLVGGWHDIFLPWMIEDFSALRRAGRAPQLIIGPWAHASIGLKRAELREGLAWLRAHLLGDDRLLRPSPVGVYLTGDEPGWLELPDWPPPDARAIRWYLTPGGRLADTAPGLEESGAASRYRYDPADPTPAVGGPVLLTREPVVDNRALEVRADVLTFTSDPLPRPLTVLGPVSAEVFARSSLEHHDVFVRLCDVDAADISWNVCDALVRVAPGGFPRDEDGVSHVTVDLWPTAHRFAAGHRLRVLISSGAHPRYARNPGTGEPLVSATKLLASDHEVFHDARHPSVVVLSVVD